MPDNEVVKGSTLGSTYIRTHFFLIKWFDFV